MAEKNMTRTIVSSCALLCTLLVCAGNVISCGDTPAEPVGGSETAPAVTEATTEEAYVYEYSQAYAGKEYRVLNAYDIYSMHGNIDKDGEDGEPLNDAMYNRVRTLEEKTGIKWAEDTEHVDENLARKAQQLIMAGDDVYSAMYIPARDLYKFTAEDYLYDLTDFPEIRLDRPWWFDSYNGKSTVAGHLYAAAGASQLMIFDSLWCLYFNETMMSTLDITPPYQLVREGKWTLDVLKTHMKAAVNLNGDETWDVKGGGNCIYGLSGGGVSKFIENTGEFGIDNENGKLVYTAGSPRYYDVVTKLSQMMEKGDGMVFETYNNAQDGAPGSYITMFEDQRALYLTAELSKTNRMREFTWSFGIVPYPKYDEAQERYYAAPFYGTPNFTIPVTVADPKYSAVIGDALTYISNEMVIPVFMNVTLEQKGLRNEDSIEMLDILMNSSMPSLSTVYNISSTMLSEVATVIRNGDDSVASIIASHEAEIRAAIDEANEVNK